MKFKKIIVKSIEGEMFMISKVSLFLGLLSAIVGAEGNVFAQDVALPLSGLHTVAANGTEDVRNILMGISLPLVDKNCVATQILYDKISFSLMLMGTTVSEVNVQYLKLGSKNTVVINPVYRNPAGHFTDSWTPIATCELSVDVPTSTK